MFTSTKEIGTMKALIILLTVVMTGCTTIKHGVVNDVRQADRIVELVIEFGAYEIPQIDDGEAVRVCRVWGFSRTSQLAVERTECISYAEGFGCTRKLRTIKYRCE